MSTSLVETFAKAHKCVYAWGKLSLFILNFMVWNSMKYHYRFTNNLTNILSFNVNRTCATTPTRSRSSGRWSRSRWSPRRVGRWPRRSTPSPTSSARPRARRASGRSSRRPPGPRSRSVLTLDTLTHSKLGDSFTSQTCQVIGQLSVSWVEHWWSPGLWVEACDVWNRMAAGFVIWCPWWGMILTLWSSDGSTSKEVSDYIHMSTSTNSSVASGQTKP